MDSKRIENPRSQQMMDLQELYDYEYSRRFPKDNDSFKYSAGELLANTQTTDDDKNGVGDYLLEGFANGFGKGMNKPENDRRSGEMEDVTQITADIMMQTQKLKQDMLNKQSKTNDNIKTLEMLTPNIRQFSMAKHQGDASAMNEIGKGIFEKLKNNGVASGNYYGVNQDDILFENEGKLERLNVSDLIAQTGLDGKKLFGEDADNVLSNLSYGAKQNYDMSNNMSQAKLDEIYSGNDLRSAQTASLQNSLTAPQDLTKGQTEVLKANLASFKERETDARAKTTLNKDYDAYMQMIKDAKDKGIAGSGLVKEFKRKFIKEMGGDPTLSLNDMLKISHAFTVKQLGGSNANEKQFNVAMDAVADITKNPEAALARLKELKTRNKEFIDETNYLADVYDKNQYQGVEYNHLRSRLKNNQPMNQPMNAPVGQNVSKSVIIRAPDGSLRKVPYEVAQELGATE